MSLESELQSIVESLVPAGRGVRVTADGKLHPEERREIEAHLRHKLKVAELRVREGCFVDIFLDVYVDRKLHVLGVEAGQRKSLVDVIEREEDLRDYFGERRLDRKLDVGLNRPRGK